ncbi:histone-arginine methyltransferase METTL23-like [Entelurus aequoreus]|uniref:histone-arginine methyltransferase METTL23-like n=1 Tax=Entelurus aequoreus TaxID=161455 RepID=UPI002B1DDA09|nr:histone-arginine methyltransferase METTL23-like [Entelurus aequoreus]
MCEINRIECGIPRIASRTFTFEDSRKDTQFEDSRKDTQFEDSRKDTQFEDSRKDTQFEDSRKDTQFEDSRKDTQFEDSRKDTQFEDSRKDTQFEDSRKDTQFEDSRKDTQERLSVFIPEVVDAQYGTYVWPSAVVLAQYVWSRRLDLKEQTVLELGAGVSLPGVVAAKCGAKIILSDDANTLLWQHTCRRSCDANNLHEVLTLPLTWGDISAHLALLAPLHLILGSDVFYEPADFEDILVTVVFLLQKNPTAEFWMTYQERRYVHASWLRYQCRL